MASNAVQRFIEPSRNGAYKWPFDGDLRSANTAMLVIDMQGDFCNADGYLGRLVGAPAHIQHTIEPIAKLISLCRRVQVPIIFSREGHEPNFSDVSETKLWRSQQSGVGIGATGPHGRFLIRGEPGWQIIPELAPVDGEIVIDKPGKGAFCGTELDLILRNKKIRNLIITGATTECCVHTTLRDANDLGYECLLVEDCCGSSTAELHEMSVQLVMLPGGAFGSVSTVAKLSPILEQLLP